MSESISFHSFNREALLKTAQDEAWPAEAVIVISNKPDALGLEKARSFGVPAMSVDHKPFGKDREGFERMRALGDRASPLGREGGRVPPQRQHG